MHLFWARTSTPGVQHEVALPDEEPEAPGGAVRFLNQASAGRPAAGPVTTGEPGTVAPRCGCSPQAREATPDEIGELTGTDQKVDPAQSALGLVDEYVRAYEESETARPASPGATTADGLGAAPIVRIVTLILTQAVRDRASDVHIEPQDQTLRVRYRVDGVLQEVLVLPALVAPALLSRIKVMAGMDIAERRRSQDGKFTTEVDGHQLDVRAATTATIWGEKCVLRLLDQSRGLLDLGQLGMPRETARTYSALIHSPSGMVLCAGPTGSGKTTTLYASLSTLNETTRNVMTIEDPVEYVLPSINQIQTSDVAGITFATGLRAILRQDPDVVLVGEIRDSDTARIAVQAALTGHFVLSSLHATDSAAAVHRLVDMGVEPFLIATSVTGVVAQRLLRRICPACRARHDPSPEELVFWRESRGPEGAEFAVGLGCDFCRGTGYRDRIGLYELMTVTPEIKELITARASRDELRRQAVEQGTRTLDREAIALVAAGVTTIAEASLASVSPLQASPMSAAIPPGHSLPDQQTAGRKRSGRRCRP